MIFKEHSWYLFFSRHHSKNKQQLKQFTGDYQTQFLMWERPEIFSNRKRIYLKEKGGKMRNQDIDDRVADRRSVLKLEGRTQAVHELSREVKDQAIERLKRSSLLYDYGEFVS